MPFGLFGQGQGATRSHQVQELLRALPNCRPTNADKSAFELPIEVAGPKLTVLNITLPPQFPQVPPALTVLVPVQHPAVDSGGRVHCRALVEWDGHEGRSGLLDAVREATDTLKRPPGMMFPSQQQAYSGASTGQLLGNGGAPEPSAARGGGAGGGVGGPGTPGPGPGDFPGSSGSELQHLPTSELGKLLEDDAHFKRFLVQWVANSPAARASSDVRQRNLQLASGNLEAQAAIAEARNHVAIVKSSEYSDAKGAFEDLYRRQEAVLAKLSPAVLLERLRQDTKKADDSTRDLLDRYFAASLPVEQFVDEYSRQRTAYHVLDLKLQAAEHTVA